MNTSESAYNLCISIRNVIERAGWDEIDVLGCTNYVDHRLMFLMQKCIDEKYIMPKEDYENTKNLINTFCEDVRNNDGTYKMGGGTYKLQIEETKLKTIWGTLGLFYIFNN